MASASSVATLSVAATCTPLGSADSNGQWLWSCPATAIPYAGYTALSPAVFIGINLPIGMLGLNGAQQANLAATR